MKVMDCLRRQICLSLFVAFASAGVARSEVSDPAGFVRLSVPSQATRMLSMPFVPFEGSIHSVFSNQLQGAALENDADRIIQWDPQAQAYRVAFKAAGTGDPSLDGRWFASGTGWVSSPLAFDVGVGFWVENRHGDQQVFLAGQVLMDASYPLEFLHGLNAFGLPFHEPVALAQAGLPAAGALGATNALEADLIICGQTPFTNWLFSLVGSPLHNQWLDASGAVSEGTLLPGRGYWYDRRGPSTFQWSRPRPFADAFSGTSNAPAILSLAALPDQSAVELTISCSGALGETLEILYQDLGQNAPFNSQSGWLIAAEGLSSSGQATLAWTDAESASRPAVTSVFSRVYVVSRQNVDSDGDGLSDARETLVHGTNPQLFDTDGDGLSDALEISLYGTDPLLADTDSDGLADAQEVAWGYAPLTGNSVQSLPWTCDFEAAEGYSAGALNGQNGWLVPSGNAVVQSLLALNGSQAVRLQGPAQVQQAVQGAAGQVVWTSLRIQMIPAPLPASTPVVPYATALVRLDSSLFLAGYDGVSESWLVATNSPRTQFLEGLHLTIKRDYSAKTWTLYRDGVPVLKDLGFADPAATRPGLFRVEGGGTRGEILDALFITTTMPSFTDDDADGIPNATELVQGTDPFNPDSDGDGMDDGRESDWGFEPLTSNDFTRLPWACGFEASEGYTAGTLNGQQGWQAGSSVVVQAASAQAGTSSTELVPSQDSTMSRYFGAQGQGEVWFETFARLQPGVLPDPSALEGEHAVLFAVNPQGRPCAYDGRLGQWRVAAMDHQVNPSEWVRLVFRLDYNLREWSLYVRNVRVFHNVPFLSPEVRTLSRAAVAVPAASPLTQTSTFVDAMLAQTTEPDLLDNDGDGMPNAWERLHGFNPENPADKWGDLDRDGLNNYEEFLYGTNPNNTDTDGDGVSDYEEVKLALSNPLVVDFSGTPQIMASLNGSQTSARMGEWYSEGGILSGIEPNAFVEYGITLPESGIYVLEVDVRQGNPMTEERRFDVFASIGDYDLGRNAVIAPYGSMDTVRFFLPYLDAGDHSVRILWKTRGIRSIFQIVAVRLVDYPGPDANQTGLPDWMDHRLANSFSILPQDESTLVSPLCLEGSSLYAGAVKMACSYVPEGEVPGEVNVGRTLGQGWFVNVALSPTSVTEWAVFNPNGRVWVTNSTTWMPLDLFQASTNSFRIRRGDSLLLAAAAFGGEGLTTITIPGVTNYSLLAGETAPHCFKDAGFFAVQAAYSNGFATNTEIQVEVVSAEFGENPICMIARQRTWDCAGLPPETVLEYDSRLILSKSPRFGGGTRFNLKSGTVDRQGLVARLSEDGPVLDSAEVKTLYFDSTASRLIARVYSFPDGSDMIEVALRFNQVPEDFEIHLVVFIGGVTFEDGTITRVVTAADLDDIGEYRYRLIRAPHQQTSVCHTTEFFQDGVLILNAAQ